MASEGASTSPPAVVGSSFSIENLLNLSDSTAKKEHTNPLTDNLLSYSVPGSSFPSVPRAVHPFSHDGLSLPLCAPVSTFNFGEIVDSHSVTYIHQFPISNNGPPLGKFKKGVYPVILVLVIVVLVARKTRLLRHLNFISHHVNR